MYAGYWKVKTLRLRVNVVILNSRNQQPIKLGEAGGGGGGKAPVIIISLFILQFS